MFLKKNFGGKVWNQWPEVFRDRGSKSLQALRKKYHNPIEKEKFRQYLFFKQWSALRHYCKEKGLLLFGDLPIYVSLDSSDVWGNPEVFKLDSKKKPAFVSGVPPDYFSETGQLWNHPVYRWNVLKKSKYRWWLERVDHNLKFYDLLRIDHYRGLVAYWEIPAGEKTAIKGKWVKAPGDDFLSALKKNFPCLPIVAEDLGFITPDVRKVMARFKIPGMKVLLFAFGKEASALSHRPHAYNENCVAYTGTHDNNTIRGWFDEEAATEERQCLFRYLGRKVPAKEVHWELIRLAMMSSARTAILPMQDVLGLGGSARMNRPSIAHGNWEWRLMSGQITPRVSEKLLEVTEIYGRC